MAKAIWNETVIAESDQVEIVEGNHYFPDNSIHGEYFKPSSTQTRCFWKGVANYYSIVVGDQINNDASWYYPDPSAKAKHIKNYVAFWKGVTIED